MANTPSNRAIKIEDLQEKFNIDESNLIIVEDDLDTKKTTIRELKKSFVGDNIEPSKRYFYSSQYISDLTDAINIAINGRAPRNIVDELKKQLDDIILSQSNGENIDISAEVIAARNGQSTLSRRLEYERNLSDASYFSKPLKDILGTSINIDGHVGLVTVTPIKQNSSNSNAIGKIQYYSKNRYSGVTVSDAVTLNESYGFKYTQVKSINTIEIRLEKTCNAGIYYFLSSTSFSKSFKDKEIILEVEYEGGLKEQFPYHYENCFGFNAKSPFKRMRLLFNETNFVNQTWVEFSNVMLSQYKLSSYVDYEYNETEQIDFGSSKVIINNDYIFEFSIPNVALQITYYDHTVSIDKILNNIDLLNTQINDKIDRCGLMTDYGTYHPFDSCEVISSDNTGKIYNADEKYERNGFTSKRIKIQYNESEDFQVKQALTDLPDTIESVSLCFYIDKLVSEKLTDDGGIVLILCSDTPSYGNINRFETTIKRSEMLHGWNVIKRPVSELIEYGNPNIYNIKSATVKVPKNENLHGQEFYINSICFNQKMKPTVILSFDGTYETSNKLVYPYLISQKHNANPAHIPATILLNDSRTIEPEEFDELIRLKIEEGWDIGSYGCNPNKEHLGYDNNYRFQYTSLYNNRQYIIENAIANPISYSAPYGNLRPITVPLLKDLGYKIARTEADSFISIFTEKDFAIPRTVIAGEANSKDIADIENSIINKIDYAIANNVALSLFVRDVTEKGSPQNAPIEMLRSIIDYISKKVGAGELQVLTMADFYHKCVE